MRRKAGFKEKDSPETKSLSKLSLSTPFTIKTGLTSSSSIASLGSFISFSVEWVRLVNVFCRVGAVS